MMIHDLSTMISAMPEQRLVPFPGHRRQATLSLFAGHFVGRARSVSHGFFENKPTGVPHSSYAFSRSPCPPRPAADRCAIQTGARAEPSRVQIGLHEWN
jgi:hypothetical protein